MKSTGIARKVDSLGKIVLPKELRVARDINVDTLMEIFVREDETVLKKFKPHNRCAITGEVSERNISLLQGQLSLSPECVRKLAQELQYYKALIKMKIARKSFILAFFEMDINKLLDNQFSLS